jgi:hypothetical protein
MRTALIASVLALGLAGLAACTNPNAIGVQVFGSVTVHCVRQSDGSPVGGALVNVGITALTADANGTVTFPQVPAGQQNFIANAPGLTGSQASAIKEGQNPDLTIQMHAQ